MVHHVSPLLLTCLTVGVLVLSGVWSYAFAQVLERGGRLKVFLDCGNDCFSDYVRDEVDLVEYVRDPAEADVHVIVTTTSTGGGGRERTVSLIGAGRFKGTDRTVKSLSESGDTEDTERRRLVSVLKIGLLGYMAQEGLATNLDIEIDQSSATALSRSMADPWNKWVVSTEGGVTTRGEETSRELGFSGRVGADRVTDQWKITTGFQLEYQREDFDLDEDEPLTAIRSEREFDGQVVRSLGDHWSFGSFVSLDTSSFDNIAFKAAGGPAIEYNFFPYSSYTRRQLRMNYVVGPYYARYVETTLFGKTVDALAQQEASITLDRREPWGSIRAELEASTFLPDWSKYRVELDGEVNVRIARGLSFTLEGSASRIRDQLSLPRRDATPEEVLLRVRRLGSGYEFGFEVGLRYTFGSIFSSIVNPRFGQ